MSSRTKKLALADICIDGGTQTRAQVSEEAVSEFAEAMQLGADFPPVIVFQDGNEKNWMADGFTRYAAAKRAGLDEILAEVREGTRKDALLFSAGSNDAHGQRRTNPDKRAAVKAILAEPEWAERSDAWIAEACKVSHTFVNNLRASSGEAEKPKKGRDQRARRKPKKDHGDAYEGEILCERCQRVGAVQDCPQCKEAREEAGKRRGRKRQKPSANGQPVFSLNTFTESLGRATAELDKLARQHGKLDRHGRPGCPELTSLQRKLSAVLKETEQWIKVLHKEKAKEKENG